MTIGCEDPKSRFKPCADCSFEYQPRGCREYRQKMGFRTVYRTAIWDAYS